MIGSYDKIDAVPKEQGKFAKAVENKRCTTGKIRFGITGMALLQSGKQLDREKVYYEQIFARKTIEEINKMF